MVKKNTPAKREAVRSESVISGSKRVEEALRESEKQFRNLFENHSAAMLVIDPETGNIIDANSAAAQFYGWSVEKLKQMQIQQINTLSPETVKAEMEKAKSMKRNHFEFSHQKADGSIRDVDVFSSKIEIKGRTFLHSIIQDITERKQVEEELRKSQELYKLVSEHTTDTMWLMDMNLKTTWQSPSVQRMRGYTFEEIAEMPLEKHLAPESLKLATEVLSVELPRIEADPGYNPVITLELGFYRKDDSTIWTETKLNLIRDVNGRPVSILGEARDITERKQAEANLKKTEDAYHLLAENMSDTLWMMDKDLNITWMSQSSVKARGMSLAEIAALPPDKQATPESFAKGAKLLGKMIAMNNEGRIPDPDASVSLDMEFYCGGGTTRWFDCTYKFIRDKQGKATGILAQARDITERKKAEEALKKIEYTYSLLSEHMSDVVWMMDLDMNITWLSPSSTKVRGYSIDEVRALPLDRQLTPESLEKAIHMFGKWTQIEKGGSTPEPHGAISTVLEFTCKDGSTVWLECATQFTRDQQGKATGILIEGRNVTKRRKVEEALQTTQNTYRLLAEHMSDIVWMMDLDLNITWLSPSAVRARGYSVEELLVLPLDRQMTPESLGKAVHLIGKWTHTEREGRTPEPHGSISTELEFICKDGHTFVADCSFQFIRDEQGKATGILAEARDITERKKVEKAVRESEEKYRVVVENALEAISISVDAKLVFANRRMAALSGYSQEELTSRSITEFIHPDDLEMVIDLQLRRWKGENVPNIYSFRVVDKAGNIQWREVSTVLITWEGKPATLNFMTDIMDRKRLEEERQRVAKLESVGVLAGGIAHDFNNILTSILGNISLASAAAAPGSDLSESLEQAEKASLRAKALTVKLLTFSKGGAPIKNLASLTELLKDTAGFALSGSNVKCDFSIPADLWYAEIDEGQVSQVIHNLVINALQAMPGGGTIELAAENISLSEAQSSGRGLPIADGNYIRIAVTDHGSGVPAEHLDKIFDPFFSTKPKGSGLGLATSFSIARQHGGHISVESVVGSGSTFYVYLPASMETVTPEQDKKEQVIVAGKARILVMDDEQELREIAGRMLKHIGYEDVEFAADGAEALNLYHAAMQSGNPFSAVILDLTIPGGMGGEATIKKLLKIDPGVKAIVSSGYADDPVMTEYWGYGFSGMVVKPYTIAELRKTVQDVIG